MNHDKRVAFHTLGCKVNFYETDKMSEKFQKAGYKVVDFRECADVYVINTCTVTNMADRKSRKMLQRARRTNAASLVVAVGCYAQAVGSDMLTELGIDLVIGNEEKEQLVSMVSEKLKIDYDSANFVNHISKSERTRANIMVQTGCNQFCTYCIIPYVRGKLKSRQIDDVTCEVQELASNGYKEIVITGIHLSSFGGDSEEGSSFVQLRGRPLLALLKEISKIQGIERIRLGSLEPRIITESFLKELSSIKQVCPHFHLSLQSGCNRTLQRMGRKYSTEEYLDKCSLIREYYNNPALTTDIIVGFPGESEEDFEESKAFAEKVGFADIHVFKYSIRNGTKAADMPEQVLEQSKTKRSNVLLQVAENLYKNYQNIFMNHESNVLWEENIIVDGKQYITGHNERYIKYMVQIDSQEQAACMVNTTNLVLADTKGKENTLIGYLLKN